MGAQLSAYNPETENGCAAERLQPEKEKENVCAAERGQPEKEKKMAAALLEDDF